MIPCHMKAETQPFEMVMGQCIEFSGGVYAIEQYQNTHSNYREKNEDII